MGVVTKGHEYFMIIDLKDINGQGVMEIWNFRVYTVTHALTPLSNIILLIVYLYFDMYKSCIIPITIIVTSEVGT